MSRSGLSSIEKEIRHQLNTHFSGVESPLFIMGVSGGIDSMSLLHIFHRLEIRVIVVHINYGKRGESSDNDAELVEKISFEWGYDCHTIKADPPGGGGVNFQQWAREFRYQVFDSLREEHEADGIAVAHHLDDQIETILQKVFRGAGLESWSGMSVWDGRLFRPMLHVSQDQITSFAEQQAIPYRVDATNLSSEFARNFLRNEWLDNLENHFPGWRNNVLRMAEQAEIFHHALSAIHRQISGAEGNINRNKFHELVPPLQRAVLLHTIKLKNPEITVSSESLYRVEELQSLQTGKEVELTSGVRVIRDRDEYVITTETVEFSPELLLRIDDLLNKARKLDRLHFSLRENRDLDFEQELYLDAEKIAWPVKLRVWKHGDKIQPLGMKGHQLVSDHLTNRKVSAAEKEKALVLESFEDRIIAVIFPPVTNRQPVGTIADSVKCNAATRLCLNIKLIVQ